VKVVNNKYVLSWNPSTDDGGVVRYGVFRDGSQVATTSATTWSTPAHGTHLFQVDAIDPTGNRSALSASVTAVEPTSKRR